jgi:hypothetical protein
LPVQEVFFIDSTFSGLWIRGIGRNKKPFRITRNGVFQPGVTTCLGRKGFAASTTLAGIWIGNLKTARGQALTKIDDGSANVLRAEWINEHKNAMHFARKIVGPPFIKNHRILHPGTAALLNVNPKNLSAVFRLAQ